MQKMEPEDARGARRSKIAVAVAVFLIVGVTGSWIYWDLFGNVPSWDPKVIKKMATAYERECVELGNEPKTCKRHIGRRHRSCLDAGAIETGAGEYRYAYEGYAGCMRPSRDADLAEFTADLSARTRGG